jgi:hypothetical protein
MHNDTYTVYIHIHIHMPLYLSDPVFLCSCVVIVVRATLYPHVFGYCIISYVPPNWLKIYEVKSARFVGVVMVKWMDCLLR